MTKNDRSVELVKKFCPNFKIVMKSQSRMHRAIGWILGKLGNKDYMTRYYTTIGQTTATPAIEPTDWWSIILHEGQHAIDSRRLGNIWFGLLYLLPQSLAFIAFVVALLVACGGPLWVLWGLLSLAFLAPLPAFGRAWAELRAYKLSLALLYWSKQNINWDKYIKAMEEVFAGGGYYFMLPCKAFVRWYFKKVLRELMSGTLKLDVYQQACKELATQE